MPGAPSIRRILANGWETTNLNHTSLSAPPHPIPCDPESAMKFAFAILVLVLVVVSFVADYKWRKWIADRRRDRQ
jgi:hypothetical protein